MKIARTCQKPIPPIFEFPLFLIKKSIPPPKKKTKETKSNLKGHGHGFGLQCLIKYCIFNKLEPKFECLC